MVGQHNSGAKAPLAPLTRTSKARANGAGLWRGAKSHQHESNPARNAGAWADASAERGSTPGHLATHSIRRLPPKHATDPKAQGIKSDQMCLVTIRAPSRSSSSPALAMVTFGSATTSVRA